jgi:hypothetical protein
MKSHGEIHLVTSRRELKTKLDEGEAARLASCLIEIFPIESVKKGGKAEYGIMLNPARLTITGSREEVTKYVNDMMDEFFDTMEAGDLLHNL